MQAFVEHWQTWLTGVFGLLLVAAAGRAIAKAKLGERGLAIGREWGAWFSLLLLRWIPARLAQSAEEKVIAPLLGFIGGIIKGFGEGLLADNKKRKRK